MKKRVWLVLLALGLVFGLAACDTETAAPEQTLPPEATATPETEEATPVPTTPEGVTEEKAGGDAEQPAEVSMGTFTGSLDEGEEGWYTFEVADGQVVSVDFTPGEDAEPMNVRLLDPEEDEVWRELGVSPTVTKSTRQLMSSSSGGMYYIQVSEGYGEYAIELAAESQDDAGSGGDAGDKVADALEVDAGQSFSGEIGEFDQEDWYTFEVTDGQVLSVDFTPGEDAEPMNVQLLNSDQDRVWRELGVDPTVTKSVERTEDVDGTYYVQVSEGNGSYTIEIE